MTRVIFIDPKDELIIHSLEIYTKESKRRADDFYRELCRSRDRPPERILIREGFITVMDTKDEIPIPVSLVQK